MITRSQNLTLKVEKIEALDKTQNRPLVKSAYPKNNFLISQPKHMLWVLKRTVSMRRFFWAPKTYLKTDGYLQFYAKKFVNLNL